MAVLKTAYKELSAQLREIPRSFIRGGLTQQQGGAVPTRHRVNVRDTALHSVVMACQQYYMRKITEAPLRAVPKNGRPFRGDTRLAMRELNRRFENINDDDDFRQAAGALFWDMHSLGDGFLWRNWDSQNANVNDYYWIPSWRVGVHQGMTANDVTYYYMGRVYTRREFAQLRNFKSSQNPARGVGALHTLVGEVYIDEQARRYAAALLANDGRPSGLMAVAGRASPFEREQASKMLTEQHGGDNTGRIAVINNTDSVDFKRINMTPSEFDFSALVKISESRVPGTLGIPASQINTYTGMETGTTNATREQDRFQVEQDLFLPSWANAGSQLSKLILPDWTDDENAILQFDTSNVSAAQKMQKEREDRAIQVFRNTGMSLYEYHRQTGSEIDPREVEKMKEIYVMGEGKNIRVTTIDTMYRESKMLRGAEDEADPVDSGQEDDNVSDGA